MERSVGSTSTPPTRSVRRVTLRRTPISFQTGGLKPDSRHAASMRGNATSPLFHQRELVEHAADDSIAQLRYSMGQVDQRESEGQQARILHLQPVIEDRDANRCTLLGVVGMGHRVDDRFANGGGWQAPSFPPPQAADHGAVQRVLLHECDRFFDCLDQGHLEFCLVDDGRLVRPGESASLDPGVREMVESRGLIESLIRFTARSSGPTVRSRPECVGIDPRYRREWFRRTYWQKPRPCAGTARATTGPV